MNTPGQIRYCACGCGEPAKRCYHNGTFKSWRSFAQGHAPNERVTLRIPTDPTDLAYAAGIVDGEGCIYARVNLTAKKGIVTYLQFQVTMCSEAVVAWMHVKFGGEVFVSQPPSAKRRTRFVWQVRGGNVVAPLTALLPYLKEKRKRAELAIQIGKMLAASKVGKGNGLSQEEIAVRTNLAAQIKGFNQSHRSEDLVQ